MYSLAISFLPRLTWLGQSVSARQRLLSQVNPDVVGDAVACAIELSDLPLAIELLEQGRSIFWAQLLQFRTELIALQTLGSDIVDQLYQTDRKLEQSTLLVSVAIPRKPFKTITDLLNDGRNS